MDTVRASAYSLAVREDVLVQEEVRVEHSRRVAAERELARVRDLARTSMEAGAARVQQLENDLAKEKKRNRTHKSLFQTLSCSLQEIQTQRVLFEQQSQYNALVSAAEAAFLHIVNEEQTLRIQRFLVPKNPS